MKPNSKEKKPNSKILQRLDIVALASILVLSLLIGIVLWNGDRTTLRVSKFSWEGKQVGVKDRQFTLTFNRPVDRASVEKNLQIKALLSDEKIKPLPGKISWTGRNLVYTLTELPIYGITYQVELQEAKQLGASSTINRVPTEKQERGMEPFVSRFSTRDRAFAYLGVEEEEKGRLILYNINNQKKSILTPADLVVTNFEIYPDGDRILFSAFDRTRQNKGFAQQQLYTVTTGLNFQSPDKLQPVGRIKLILDAKDYHNFKFDLSANGKTIVIQRTNRLNPAESGLWVVPEEGEPRPLGMPGGEFVIAPDGKTLAVAQRQGIAIVPLTPEMGSPKFFPEYAKILGFSKDGSRKLMVKDNADSTRSLFLVTNKGVEKKLFSTKGQIIDCSFEPRQEQTLYCIKTDLVEEEGQYREESSLAAINTETTEDLLELPNYREVHMSMSPDGLVLLFDQVVTTTPRSNKDLITESGQAIVAGRLWGLRLSDIQTADNQTRIQPEKLFSGFNPQWLP
ncbi:MAG: Ig-like domain-containing protein [Xenococcaceae cyanobacterium]